MTDARQSLLTITGMSGRVSLNAHYNAFLVSGTNNADLRSGFRIAEEETEQSLLHPAVSLVGQPVAKEDAADLQLDMHYNQEESYQEVDLSLRWTNLPPSGVWVANNTDYTDFDINKKAIEDSSGVYGKISQKNEPIQTPMSLKLWFDNPDSIPHDAQISVEIGYIAEDDNDPRAVERITDNGPTKIVPLGIVTLYPRPQD
ncbi:hypothetical protein ACMDCT_04455 [Halomonadaceae bacterium KBTZ08]